MAGILPETAAIHAAMEDIMDVLKLCCDGKLFVFVRINWKWKRVVP